MTISIIAIYSFMFVNREEAGMRLAPKLSKFTKGASVIVALPRGGVVVGRKISDILNFPLFALIVKKIGAPQNPELAIGATGPPVGGDSVVFWDESLINILNIDQKTRKNRLRDTIKTIRQLEKTLKLKRVNVRNKNVILVDDGVATGATVIAASLILKRLGSEKVILAVPVISKRTKREISKYFDKIISVDTPNNFQAVGEFYREFPQIEDAEVIEILNRK